MNQRILLFFFLTFFIKLNSVSQDQIFSTIVSHEGKYGLVENKSGNTVLPIEYDSVISYTSAHIIFSFYKNHKHGYALLFFDKDEWEYHWEISELDYDTIYSPLHGYLIRKKDNRYDFLCMWDEVLWSPYRDPEVSWRNNKYRILTTKFTSAHSYDTIFLSMGKTRFMKDEVSSYIPAKIVFRENNQVGFHLIKDDVSIETPCQWDSLVYVNTFCDYAWKDGKFAILFTDWGDYGEPQRIAESSNYILTTPYIFTNKDEFYIEYLDLGSPVVVVIQHGKPFKIYIDYGSKEINFHYADGSDLIVDTSYFIPEIFRAPFPPSASHRDGSLYYNDGFRLQVNGARPWTYEYDKSRGVTRGAMFITDSAGQIIYSFSDTAYGYFLNGGPPSDNLVFGKTWNRDGLGADQIQENYQETFKIFDIKTGEVLWEISEPQTRYYLDDFYYPYNMIRAEYLDKKGIDKEKIVGYIVYNKKGLKVCKYKWISNWFYSDVPVEKP
ncbi:MAG: hypothetical protein IPM74_05950 [Crocinitomicaceae bacterium]|nr:hypothetical protein [Crocinitomicaceae bacterium]MBK8925446.1 hypothetical protein [Crocinitomicaceae bacterium]